MDAFDLRQPSGNQDAAATVAMSRGMEDAGVGASGESPCVRKCCVSRKKRPRHSFDGHERFDESVLLGTEHR